MSAPAGYDETRETVRSILCCFCIVVIMACLVIVVDSLG